MLLHRAFVIAATLHAFSFAQECPELPDTGVSIGEPVPIHPEHIPAGCSDFEVLVARGTSEPNYEGGNGTLGIIVGDPVVSNLTLLLPGARGYPVQYPASAAIISGTIRGYRDVLQRLTTQSRLCPAQTFALVGYSQGAGVMHAAADRIPTSLYSKIKAIVVFGDPGLTEFPTALQNRLLVNCAEGDPVCDSGDCTYYHLTYIQPVWINRAVSFLANAFLGTPLPPSTGIGL